MIETELFAENIEKEFAMVLKKVLNKKIILKDNYNVIFLFIIFQLGRTTGFNNKCRKFVKQKYEENILKKYKKQLEIKKIARIEVKPHKNTNIRAMFVMYKVLYEKMKTMDIVLLKTTGIGNKQFVTSDDPIAIVKVKRVKGSNDVSMSIINFPLSPQLSILINDYGANGLKKVDENTVVLLNGFITKQSDRYLISRGRKNLLKLMEKDSDKGMSHGMIDKIEKYL